ncbi:hypothetical protein BKA62DRAFT_308303 [Auriculariales sp. MPI-PUGE-AT-0066]|nr:hypothetical protein BKA62DRAFT_308303 [Auriculariales sp. MPI-PUGE-AT-0066]
MSLRTWRSRHWLKDPAPQSSGAHLLPELLLPVFAYLAPAPSTVAAEDDPDRWQMPLQQANLAKLILVCKVWRGIVEHVLYQAVSLKDAKACRRFARTLKRRPKLGSLVRSIYFPNELLTVGRPVEHLSLLRRHGKLRGLCYKRSRQNLGQAVSSILEICVKTEVVKLHTGAEGFGSYMHKDLVQSRIRACTLEVQWPSNSCFYSALGAANFSELCSPEENSRWKQLMVLRVCGFSGRVWMRGLLPVTWDQRANIRGCFPNLRTLILKDVIVNREQLKSFLLALAPTLRTLGLVRTALCADQPSWSEGSQYHPLDLLDSLPKDALRDVEDIRVDYCAAYELWPDFCRERALTRWCNVTRLSVGTEVLQFFEFVPPALKSLTIYEVGFEGYVYIRPLQRLLDTVGHVVKAIPTWKAMSPGLCQVGLEARDTPLAELSRWKITSLILHELMKRSNVLVIVNVA